MRVPLSSPFVAEHVVVPARATSHWLAAALSDRLGVWANHSVYTPAGLLEALGGESAATPGTWAIVGALRKLPAAVGADGPAGYVADDADGLRTVQLAGRVAALFDRYARWRPDMLRRWRAGDGRTGGETAGERWQAALWREVTAGGGDVPAAVADFVANVERQALPERLSVFAVDVLAPLELELLHAVAARIDVAVYALDDAPLVAALAASGVTVVRLDGPAGADTALRQAQRGGVIGQADASVRLHVCHSPLREVEVLRDALLQRFDADPTLQPEDVLVLAPDMDLYAPAVRGVFGTAADVSTGPGARAWFPVSLADSASAVDAPGIVAFQRILAIVGSRRGLSEVADLFATEPVYRRFGVADGELLAVRAWLVAAAVRWGEDAAFRERFDNPPLPETTWRWGLDRLLLGYAMEGEGTRLFGGLLPVDGIEGPGAQPLGALCTFCDTLFTHLAKLEALRPAYEWPSVLLDAYDALVDARGPHARARAVIVRVLDGMDGDTVVGLAGVRAWLDGRIELTETTSAFYAGGITFAALRAGRTVPARVVCLLGLDHDRLPRDPARLAFDRVEVEPLPGDTNPRTEDRLAFRAAVRAAGEHLHLSHVGHDIRSNAERPPSVLVAELFDGLAAEARRALTITHPMQPFSPAAFREPRHPSYSRPWHAGAVALTGEKLTAACFFTEPLAPPAPGEPVALASLIHFFRNPAAALLRARLGLVFEQEPDGVEDRETMSLDRLASYAVGERLVTALLAGGDVDTLRPVLLATGTLPLGTPGVRAYDDIAAVAATIAACALACPAGPARPALDVDLALDVPSVATPVHLVGRVDDTHAAGLRTVTYGSLVAKRALASWIRHLANVGSGHASASAWLVGRKGGSAAVAAWGPVPEARTHLATLVGLYLDGQCTPLPFMPAASMAYVEALDKAEGKGLGDADAHECARDAARGAWEGGWSNSGEGDDPAVARCFDATVVDQACFHDTALAVFGPLVRQRRNTP